MNQFSNDMDVGGICLPCQDGNLFYLGNPDNVSVPPIRGLVGGQSTPTLPVCRIETLQNTLAGTLAQVELDIGGQRHTLAPGADAFSQCSMPGQLRVNIGLAPPCAPVAASAPPPQPFVPDPVALSRARGETGSLVPIGRYQSAGQRGGPANIMAGHEMSELDMHAERSYADYAAERAEAERESVTAFEINATHGAPPGGEGSYGFDDIDDTLAAWLAHGMADYVKTAGGASVSIGNALLTGNNRRFLAEVGFQRIRIFRMRGVWMVAFTGSRLPRTLVRGTTAGAPALARMRVTLLDAAVNSPGANAAAGVRSVASRGGAIGIAFVAAFDVAEYFSQPANERVLSDLLVDLGFTFATAVAGAVLGTIAAGFAMTLAAAFAPVALVAALGIGTAIVVGVVVGMAVDATGLEASMRQAIRNADMPAGSPGRQMPIGPGPSL